jgi:hypothetical protein
MTAFSDLRLEKRNEHYQILLTRRTNSNGNACRCLRGRRRRKTVIAPLPNAAEQYDWLDALALKAIAVRLFGHVPHGKQKEEE